MEKRRHWSWEEGITCQGKAGCYLQIKNRKHSRDLISWGKQCYDSKEAESDEICGLGLVIQFNLCKSPRPWDREEI